MSDKRRLKPYRVEIPVRAGRDDVWAAVTQPELLHQWFGWEYDGLDAEIQQIFVDAATRLTPERMGWADGSYLDVSGDETSSVVCAVREGPQTSEPDRFDAIEEGWKAFLVQLRFLLEQHPTGARRTIYLTGEATGDETLALIDGDWRRVGRRVAWTIDPDGHLVVAAGNAPLADPAASGMQIIVSTYGLSDREFRAYRDGWARRWKKAADGALVTVAGSPDPTT